MAEQPIPQKEESSAINRMQTSYIGQDEARSTPDKISEAIWCWSLVALYMWFTQRSQGTPVSGPLLAEKAKQLHTMQWYEQHSILLLKQIRDLAMKKKTQTFKTKKPKILFCAIKELLFHYYTDKNLLFNVF